MELELEVSTQVSQECCARAPSAPSGRRAAAPVTPIAMSLAGLRPAASAPALIFWPQRHVLASAVLHSRGPASQCHFRLGQSTFQHASAACPLCLPRRIFASPLRHLFLSLSLSSVCNLKETSSHRPHCMSPLRSPGTFTECFKIDFPCCGFLHNPNNFLALPLLLFFPTLVASEHIVVLHYCATALKPRQHHVFLSQTQCSN